MEVCWSSRHNIDEEAAARTAEDSNLLQQINNIQLKQGPKGDKGDTGADSTVAGPQGDPGADGESIQGPQGDPGTSSWTDGYGTVSTTGSVQIGSDTADGTDACNTDNAGTIRFNTDTKSFEGCNGIEWVSITPPITTYSIGDEGPAGGIVFYITDDGLHGMEAAPSDQSSGAEWGCYPTLIAGADGIAVGTGAQNTEDILAGCSTSGIAARICDEYTLGDYDDWYLPSKDELNLLYQQKGFVGGFASSYYWSSTEYSFIYAWGQSFYGGYQYDANKYDILRVRAVRAF